MPGGEDDERALTLADVVDRYADRLAPAFDTGSSDADERLAAALVRIWRDGPPYDLSAHPELDQVSPTGAAVGGPDDGFVEPIDLTRMLRIHRLAQSLRARERRGTGQRVGAVVAAVAAAALVLAAVLVVPRIADQQQAVAQPVAPTRAAAVASTPTRTPSTRSSDRPTPSPTTSPSATPSATEPDTSCHDQYCLPADADSWSTQVVAAAYEQLDQGGGFSGGGIITATTLASNRRGTLLMVTVSGADTGTTVEVWASDRSRLLPACGVTVGATCLSVTTLRGVQIEAVVTQTVIEARVRSGDTFVQMVLRDPEGLRVTTYDAYAFLLDQRLWLP